VTVSKAPARPRSRRTEDELGRRVDEQAAVINALAERLAALEAECAALRGLTRAGQREVLRRLEELRPPPAAGGNPTWGPTQPSASGPVTPDGQSHENLPTEVPVAAGDAVPAADYVRLVSRVKALVRTLVPVGSVVAVASRGDESLVDLDGRIGWHYPRSADGRWAGYHPQDSAAAVAHLDELWRHGARFVLFPATARWWLDYYAGLRRHLEGRGRLVLDREDTCALFALDN
jgi:hypothetical protein